MFPEQRQLVFPFTHHLLRGSTTVTVYLTSFTMLTLGYSESSLCFTFQLEYNSVTERSHKRMDLND